MGYVNSTLDQGVKSRLRQFVFNLVLALTVVSHSCLKLHMMDSDLAECV